MFQTEKEDLIPRCAPKPSAFAAAAGFQPSVPEISIVFTQRESGQCTCSSPPEITSYSLWKNKCLSNIGFPPESLNTELTSAGQIANKAGIAEKNKESSFQTAYSTESGTPKFSPRCILLSSYSNIGENSAQQKQSQPFLLNTLEENILTASTGTQTDDLFNNSNESLATKEDIAQIKSMIFEMENKHRHLLKTLLNLLEEKHELTSVERKPELRNIGTQYGEQLIEGHLKYKSIAEDLPEKEHYDNRQKINIQTSTIQGTGSTIMPRSQKIATEQSIVMNELAIKYLPNKNLNGMLKEVLTERKVQNQYESPLKNIGNMNKNSTDLSTASYKYLTKYRLLPCNNLPKFNSEDQHENLLDLEMIRCKPKFI